MSGCTYRSLAYLLFTCLLLAVLFWSARAIAQEMPQADYYALQAAQAPVIDGTSNDACWERAAWKPIDQLWLGEEADAEDFSGRYKIVWSAEKLYILAEITDNIYADVHADPLERYWDDDCLEIFIDEDHSGGMHQYSHNAFAYHIALDGRVVDIGTDKRPREYTSHLTVGRFVNGSLSTWEIGLDIYTDQYDDTVEDNARVTLEAGKIMGYGVAYCDADNRGFRESFYGSVFMPGSDKDRAYIDASTFGTLLLIEQR